MHSRCSLSSYVHVLKLLGSCSVINMFPANCKSVPLGSLRIRSSVFILVFMGYLLFFTVFCRTPSLSVSFLFPRCDFLHSILMGHYKIYFPIHNLRWSNRPNKWYFMIATKIMGNRGADGFSMMWADPDLYVPIFMQNLLCEEFIYSIGHPHYLFKTDVYVI